VLTTRYASTTKSDRQASRSVQFTCGLKYHGVWFLFVCLFVCLLQLITNFISKSTNIFQHFCRMFGKGIGPLQGLYLHTGQQKTYEMRTDNHSSSGIRIHNPSVRQIVYFKHHISGGHCDGGNVRLCLTPVNSTRSPPPKILFSPTCPSAVWPS
jgi:hypothetical protein